MVKNSRTSFRLLPQKASGAENARPSGAGGEVYVVQDGPADAPALVLIHGLAASGRSWEPLVPLLAESHHVIRIDLLGHGRSAKPDGADYAVPEQARRVGEVLDRLGVGHALAVGHSSGGSVVTALTERRPDLVTAVALLNSGPHIGAHISQAPLNRLLPLPVIGQLLWRLRTDSLIRRAAATAVTRDIEIPQAVVDDVRGMTHHGFMAGSQASSDYLRRRPLPDRLATLGKPLLVVFGDEDRRWHSSSAADYRAVPGARIEMLPGVGHSPPLEEPRRTAELLLAFAAAAHPPPVRRTRAAERDG
ncbi:alpha/beta fold hydrolase [Streptomyces iconiensis]|uniref:Alpha/beta fold hydrolase n=1 Tax=Streptomyces iconiensis TaxID=1384038 RepID=A0ABT7A3I0_9ACTN|nr:alpha/beta fold hydrolase [Streptomyces iconiensis]MDJ1135902.1 alpha/beta fold hydrolase [Streptomyces iconiensis]